MGVQSGAVREREGGERENRREREREQRAESREQGAESREQGAESGEQGERKAVGERDGSNQLAATGECGRERPPRPTSGLATPTSHASARKAGWETCSTSPVAAAAGDGQGDGGASSSPPSSSSSPASSPPARAPWGPRSPRLLPPAYASMTRGGTPRASSSRAIIGEKRRCRKEAHGGTPRASLPICRLVRDGCTRVTRSSARPSAALAADGGSFRIEGGSWMREMPRLERERRGEGGGGSGGG